MDLINAVKDMYSLLSNVEEDIEKFENGNNSAGTCIRKTMQDIKTMAHDIRVAVQNEINSKKK